MKSWTHFEDYHLCNIVATHQLLEALKDAPNLNRLVYASTSSVYGRYASGDEMLPLRPSSPYGVTKLTAENLCRVYGDEFDLPIVILRVLFRIRPAATPGYGLSPLH